MNYQLDLLVITSLIRKIVRSLMFNCLLNLLCFGEELLYFLHEHDSYSDASYTNAGNYNSPKIYLTIRAVVFSFC